MRGPWLWLRSRSSPRPFSSSRERPSRRSPSPRRPPTARSWPRPRPASPSTTRSRAPSFRPTSPRPRSSGTTRRAATRWRIEVTFADGSTPVITSAAGPRPNVGEIDPRCVSEVNEPPRLTPERKSAHTWKPDAIAWRAIKERSVAGPATVRIVGLAGEPATAAPAKAAAAPDGRAERRAPLDRLGADPHVEGPRRRADLLPRRAAHAVRGGEGDHPAARAQQGPAHRVAPA